MRRILADRMCKLLCTGLVAPSPPQVIKDIPAEITMQDFEKLGLLYLGKIVDPETNALTQDYLVYDAKDLVTHAVCVGMTGSGKTGLCIGLLEEAALDCIPALVIDPKGDLANLLLTFPGLKPENFAPWVNPDDAARKGVSAEDFAAQQAELWRGGLEKW